MKMRQRKRQHFSRLAIYPGQGITYFGGWIRVQGTFIRRFKTPTKGIQGRDRGVVLHWHDSTET